MRAVFWLLLLAAPVAAQTLEDPEGTVMVAGREDGSEAGFRAWVTGFRTKALEAGVAAATFDSAMRAASYLPQVVERDRKQSEFTKTIWDYLDTAVSGDRVTLGLQAIAANRDLLDRIEAEYGVEKEVAYASYDDLRKRLDFLRGLQAGGIRRKAILAAVHSGRS